jgi:hypothetical protein
VTQQQDNSNGKLANLPASVAPAAEFYASQLGWRVFPLYEMGAAGVCSCAKGAECRVPGKHPRVSIPSGEHAVHPATTNVEQIRAWWKKWPNANIGVWLEGSNTIILDIDKNDKKDGFKGLQEIMAHENQTTLPPTLCCKTPSGGEHHYFEFCEGVPNKANSLGPGLDTWHSGHYVILPPSNHVKGVYQWADLAVAGIAPYPDWLKPKSRSTTEASGGIGGPAKRGRPAKERLDPNDPEDVERLTHALQYVDHTNREIWVAVGFAIARAFDWSDLGFSVYDEWSAKAHNYDEKKTREQYFKQSKVVPSKPITTASIFEWARQHQDYKTWSPADDRPYEIKERDADHLGVLVEMGDIIGDFPIYQRGPKIVEIIPVNQDGGITDGGTWFPKGSYVLREVGALQMASRLLPAKVRWMRKTARGWKPGAVNVSLCSAFLDIGNWPHAHKLRAFVQHPTLRDDGTLLSGRGFDKQSGLFLTDELPVSVDPSASRADALKALDFLLHPFEEFKWIDGPVSKAALIAAVLTTGVRHLFDEGVPLFAIDAPRPGSGKSKIVKCISNLWYGQPMATTPYSADPEEMKKHLASLLLAGSRVVLFDNVHPNTKINDPTLNALLTSGRITFRELGSQRMLEFDSATTFFMTGNNLKIMGDMIRRTIRMTIDPGGVHPMDRKFKIDPLEGYILDNRVELISAALTMLVAFFNAGCPNPNNLNPLASFEQWSILIRNLLIWLGLEDVKECISQGYDQDDESLEIEHLIERLCEIPELHTEGLSSAMILPMIDNNKPLREAMIPFISERWAGGISHPRVVTTALSQVAKIAVKGKRLLRVGPVWVIRGND